MTENLIGSSVESDLTSAMTDFSVDTETTEGADGQVEVWYQNSTWNEDYGYYMNIPEFKRVVDTKVLWTMGGGFEADDATTLLLMNIKGNGKDSFNGILKNQIKVKIISKDSFAEIIRDDNGVLVNLKPLDPSSIRIVQNTKGMIKRYEQVNKVKEVLRTFQPGEMFHLSHERIADEIKGTRIVKSLKWLIDAKNEALHDWRKVLHRNVYPVNIFYLDTDDTAEIAAFKVKADNAKALGENIYMPKGTAEWMPGGIAPNATLSPLPWADMLNDKFYQAVGVPQIIFGNAKAFTDASGKIVYLSYEQVVKDEQLYVEEQVLGQLNLEINLKFPASLQNELISSREKDPDLQAAQPNDTTAELEGAT